MHAGPYSLLLIVLFLTACANPFADYYVNTLGGRPLAEVPDLERHVGEVQVFSSANMEQDAAALIENGFTMIGYSSFNGPSPRTDGAVQQAQKLGAAMVLIQSRYTDTESKVIPYTVQNPSQTVTTYHQGSVYGGIQGGYSGSSTTTVPGGYTTHFIPHSVRRFDFLATYWVRAKPPILGVGVRDLPSELRQQLQRNSGVLIVAVRKGSPAFNADLLHGDVIVQIAGYPVTNEQSFGFLIPKFAGQQVKLEVIRNGKPRVVSVRLNNPSW